MRIVVALGGNALLERGEKPDAAPQLRHIEAAAHALAPVAESNDLIICHGNGPQVGLLALESENDRSLTHPYPLDVLGAQTQGMIGYWLSLCLRNAGVTRPVVSVLTQTLVGRTDPAFAHPTKFVGPVYDRAEASRLAGVHRWDIAADGNRWRRVVASPAPIDILELHSIIDLVQAQTLVVCGGGGGVPVVDDGTGRLRGVDAVIDKDLTAALLATAVHADRLLLLTDVRAVMQNFGAPDAQPISLISSGELRTMQFPAGSMGPKIDACLQFTAATGHAAAIGALTEVAAILAGTAGTTISA
ncbi:MAG: carbamate kinase [Jatrophihabitantaceae bacterium]